MDRRMRLFLYGVTLGLVAYWFIFHMLLGARMNQMH